MVFYQFFEHIGLNIGPATQLLVLPGLRGCRRKPLFGRADPVLADLWSDNGISLLLQIRAQYA